MKRIHFLAIIVTMCITTSLVSCSSEDEFTIEENSVLDKELRESKMLQELQAFNDSITNVTPMETIWSTRGTKDYLKLVKADVEGAIVGGAAGLKLGGKVGLALGSPITGGVFGAFLGAVTFGAFCSWLDSPGCSIIIYPKNFFNGMMEDTKALLNDDMSINSEKINVLNQNVVERIELDKQIISKVDLTTTQMNIGKMHNILLSSADGSVEVKKVSTPITRNSIDTSLFNAIIESKEFDELYDTTVDLLDSDEINPKVEYAIKLFNDVFENYSSDNDDVVLFINRYKNIINNSNEIADEEKEWIFGALATALYSYNYWTSTYSK